MVARQRTGWFHELREKGDAWWGSHPDQGERVAGILLTLVCGSLIFSTALVQIFIVVLTGFTVYTMVSRHTSVVRRTPLDAPYLMFVLCRVFSLFTSQDPLQSLPALHIEFFYYLVFFLITQTVRTDELLASECLGSVLIVAGICAALVGTAKVGLSLVPRASSTTAGTYTLGGFLCPVLVLSLFMPGGPKDLRSGIRTTAIWIILCVGIVLTLDRLHWVGMGLALLGALLLPGNGVEYRRWNLRNRRLAVLVVCVLLATTVFIPMVQVRIAQIPSFAENMSGRDVLWRGAAMLWLDHPVVGFGPRTFTEIFPLFSEMRVRGVGCWHNDYLQVYMESGLLGLSALFWLIGAVYVHSWNVIRVSYPRQRAMVIALLSAVTMMLFIGGMLDLLNGILFRVLLGLLALHLRFPRPMQEPEVAATSVQEGWFRWRP